MNAFFLPIAFRNVPAFGKVSVDSTVKLALSCNESRIIFSSTMMLDHILKY